MRRLALMLLGAAAVAGIIWMLRDTARTHTTYPSAPAGEPVTTPDEMLEPEPDRVAESDSHALPDVLVDPSITIQKSRRALTVFSAGEMAKVYRVGLGFAPEGDKEREGDGRTPEGEFYVCTRNARSRYHRALGLSYPAAEDAERGLAEGLITSREHRQITEALRRLRQPNWNTALGGEIMIHGAGGASDWTLGCIALEDAEAEELFDAIPLGTTVEIVP